MANSEIIGAGQDTARRVPKTNTITCGDCLEIMQSIPDKSIDMILCDLPYGTTACKWDTVIPFSLLWEQYKRVVKPKSGIVLTASQPFTSALIMSNIADFHYCWVWDKRFASNFSLAKYQPLKRHEDIAVFSVGACVYHPQKTIRETPIKLGKNVSKSGSANLANAKQEYDKKEYLDKNPESILFFNNRAEGMVRSHPTQKPVALFEYLIRTYTNEGNTVLDNCIGSGTTAIACINTGRNYIGIEKEEKYCRIAEERIHALRSPAQNTMEICHTAPNTAMAKCQQIEIGL